MSIHGEIFDITFIGAGPVGLYGAIYAGNRKLRAKIIESQPHAGGRLSTFYPEKIIHDVAGHPEIRAQDLIDRLVEQSEKAGAEFFFGQKVKKLTADSDGIWSLHTDAGEHRSRTVVIAAGVAAFLPDKLDLPGTETLEGSGVYYNIENLDKFSGKRVVIVGTGDHALQWAVQLRSVASKVTLIHRLNRLAAPDDVQQMLKEAEIDLRFPFHEIKEIHGDTQVQAVTVLNTATGKEQKIEADALVLNIGFVVNLHTFSDWDLAVQHNSLAVNEMMETNLPGVYAAGDIVTHPGKLKLISTGAGEAAAAVANAVNWIGEKEQNVKRSSVGQAKAFEDQGAIYSGYESVQIAIMLEQHALEFYKAAFYRAGNDQNKGLFARMQRNKMENIAYLREQVMPIFDSGAYAHEDLDGTAAAYLASDSSRFVFAGADLAKEALKNIGSELQNIYTGIQVESDLNTFLGKLSTEKRLADAREHFSRLIDIKEQELNLLRSRQAELMEAGVVD